MPSNGGNPNQIIFKKEGKMEKPLLLRGSENVGVKGKQFSVKVVVRVSVRGTVSTRISVGSGKGDMLATKVFRRGTLRSGVEHWLKRKNLPIALYLPAAYLAKSLDERAAFSDPDRPSWCE